MCLSILCKSKVYLLMESKEGLKERRCRRRRDTVEARRAGAKNELLTFFLVTHVGFILLHCNLTFISDGSKKPT